MIMWPKAKRAVSIATAQDIVKVLEGRPSKPVGVFVDESAE